MTSSSSITQTTGLKRSSLDKYYTSDKIVKKCIESFKTLVNYDESDICIEPSAGNGSFISGIMSLFNICYFYDIKPENSLIKKQDFLEVDNSQFYNNHDDNANVYTYDNNTNIDKSNTRQIHLIGNPPFGRQSSLAIKFIKKSCGFADTISFILPKSFKKDSMKKHFDKYFHLELEYDLPDNSFIVNGQPHSVPCVFQIWVKKNTPRQLTKVLKPTGFKFVKKDEDPDISFRRVGVYAGKISQDIKDKSIKSHYFIKFDNTLTSELIEKIKKIDFINKADTVGAKSISKQELIKELIEIL